MTWTTTPPTEPGYYWAVWDKSFDPDQEPVIVRVERDGRGAIHAAMTGTEEWEKLSEFTRWYGPLTPPDDGPQLVVNDGGGP